jgi:AcrR family transcriptional regulator
MAGIGRYRRRMSASRTPPAPKLVRGAPIVARVLDATIEELARAGYEGLTLERVASRAGVHRTTLFRRWPTKAELVRAAFERATRAIDFDWDTGSLRGDLEVFVERVGTTMVAPTMLGFLRAMLGARAEPALRELAATAEATKLGAVLAFFERAARRGELRPDLDRALFLDGLMGLLVVRVVFQGEPVTPAFVARLVEHVMQLVSPRRRQRSPGR